MNGQLKKKHEMLYRISVSGIFLAIAVVVKLTTTVNIPIMGASGMKIGFSQIFATFPAILFGQWYGGAVFALTDFLSYLIKPDGAFLPLLTLTQFATGFFIGVFYRIMKDGIRRDRFRRGGRVILAVVLVLIGALGVKCQLSLISDGIITSVIPDIDTLGEKDELEEKEKDIFSSLVLSLAKYSNNSVTVTKATDNGSAKLVVIPSYINGTKVTSIADTAVENLTCLAEIYIPSTVTTIPKGIFEQYRDDIVIYTTEGSTASAYADENSLACVEMTEQENTAYLTLTDGESEIWYPSEYTVSRSYQKNLRGYIIFMTFGLEGIALLGILMLLFANVVKGQNALFFLAVIAPTRIAVTTVNTEILRQALMVWNGRSFYILLIPRLGEEIVSCIIHAWIIAFLYGIYEKKIAKQTKK